MGTLEVGKTYMTVSGKRTGLMRGTGDPVFQFETEIDGGTVTYTPNGKYFDDGDDSSVDISFPSVKVFYKLYADGEGFEVFDTEDSAKIARLICIMHDQECACGREYHIKKVEVTDEQA